MVDQVIARRREQPSNRGVGEVQSCREAREVWSELQVEFRQIAPAKSNRQEQRAGFRVGPTESNLHC